MSDKDGVGVVIVKDEQSHSPAYQRGSLYTDDVYKPTTHLNAEHLYNDELRHGVSRQYHWMSNGAGDPVMDCGKGNNTDT